MKINQILLLLILSFLVSGCSLRSAPVEPKPESKLIIADEKFCIAETESNVSSEQAYEIAKNSECATISQIKEDCNCDSATFTCEFILETDKADCNPICVVDLKTATAKIDWHCTTDTPAGD